MEAKGAAEVARTEAECEARKWNWELLLLLHFHFFTLFHQVYFLPLMFAQFKKFSIAICIRTHIRTCFASNSNNRRRRRSRNNYEQGRGWAAPQGRRCCQVAERQRKRQNICIRTVVRRQWKLSNRFHVVFVAGKNFV